MRGKRENINQDQEQREGAKRKHDNVFRMVGCRLCVENPTNRLWDRLFEPLPVQIIIN